MSYDAIIIGAGMSGIAAGIRLAMYDKSVRPGDGLRAPGEDDRRMVRGGSILHRAVFGKASMRTPAAPSQQVGHYGTRASRALRPVSR